jgi:purine-nucleoside phosphorylase
MTPFDPSPAIAAARERAAAAGVFPKVGFVLGSGLAPLSDAIAAKARFDTTDLPGYPPSTAPGHVGKMILGDLGGVPVAALKGRVHVYEGRDLAVAALPSRVLCGLGVDLLVLTNAAGGLDPNATRGDVMLISDHLNLLGGSPLEGPNHAAYGPRFPDQSNVYPKALRDVVRARAKAAASKSDDALVLREGVYAAVRGPQYETPAEVRMLAALGADAVGMSTVPEAIVAAHMGVPVLGLSVMTNWAAGVRPKDQPTITEGEVLDVGRIVAPKLAALIGAALPELLAAARPYRRSSAS